MLEIRFIRLEKNIICIQKNMIAIIAILIVHRWKKNQKVLESML